MVFMSSKPGARNIKGAVVVTCVQEENGEELSYPNVGDEVQQQYSGVPPGVIPGEDTYSSAETDRNRSSDWDGEVALGVKKSVFARIQEDFPRTPSPVYGMTGVLAAAPPPPKTAHSKALPAASRGKVI